MKPFSPAQSMHSTSRKSPRKGTKYMITKPNIPFGTSSSIVSSFEYDLGKSAFSIIKPEEVNRQEVRELKERTSEELHRLYEQEQRGNIPSMQRYVEQLKILEGSMRDLGGMVRKHCNDQADLLELMWSSAADLFSVVCKSLSDKVTDLEYRLAEETYMHKKWKEKANLFKHRFQQATASNDLTGKAVIDPSHLRDLEEEILIKDRELIKMQKTIANLSIWFPRFSKFSDSVLGRFLPPVENIEVEDADEEEIELSATSKAERQLASMGKGKGKSRKMGAQNIDPQVLEAMNLIRSKQLAQDNLLRDLKRLEQLGIGLHIFTGSEDWMTLQRTFSAISDSGANVTPTPSNAYPQGIQRNSIMSTSHDESAALNMGLFNSPSIGASFSATTGLEYILRSTNQHNTKASFASKAAGGKGSFVSNNANGEKKTGEEKKDSFLSDENIREAANKVASLFQSSTSQAQPQVIVPGKKKDGKKKKKKQRHHDLSIHVPPPTVLSPARTPVLTMQEFNRLQGRKFSQMVQLGDKFYSHEQYRHNAVGADAVAKHEQPASGNDNINSIEHADARSLTQPVMDAQPASEGHLAIDTTVSDAAAGLQTAYVQVESDGEEEDEDSDVDDGHDEYLLLHDRFQQALKEVQALEIIHKKHVQQHEESVAQYDRIVKQLRADIQLLRRQLGKANHSSTQMIKSLPPLMHTNLSLHTLYNKLLGVVVVKVGEVIRKDDVNSALVDTVRDEQSLEQEYIQAIHKSLDMFFVHFSQAKLPSDLSVYNSYIQTTLQPDSLLCNVYDTYLESTLNGQQINTHTLPLLGVQVLVQEFREKSSVFSLLCSVYTQHFGVQVKSTSAHTHSFVSKPEEFKRMLKSVLMMLIQHLRQNLVVDVDSLSSLHSSEEHSEANIDSHNAYMAYMTPSNAMLHVLKRLFGLDQVKCLSNKQDSDGWNAVKYIDHIQHFPRKHTNQSTIQTTGNINNNNDAIDRSAVSNTAEEPNSSLSHPTPSHPHTSVLMDSIIEEEVDEDDMDVFSLHPYLSDHNNTGHVLQKDTNLRQDVSVSFAYPDDEMNVSDEPSADMSFQAMHTIFSFDTYLHILRASLAFHNSSSTSTSSVSIPVKDSDLFIDRIFHVCSVSFATAKLKALQHAHTTSASIDEEDDVKKNKNQGDDDEEGVVEDEKKDTVLGEGEEGGRLLHSATQPPWWRYITKSTKEELKRRLFRHVAGTSDASDAAIPLPYYHFYALKSVQQTHTQLSYILRNMHKFLLSMLPRGVDDSLFAPLLTYLLLTSPLLTHHLPATPHSNKQKHALRPYRGAVPVPLLHELVRAQNNKSLTDGSFAEIVLRGGVRGLAETLTPLLASTHNKPSEGTRKLASEQQKRGINGGTLTDLACSEPLGRLSQTLSSQYSNSISGNSTSGGTSDSSAEESEFKYIQRLLGRMGTSYFHLLQHLFEVCTIDEDESHTAAKKHANLRANAPKASGYEEYLLIHRYLYNNSDKSSSAATHTISMASVLPEEDDPEVLYTNRPFLTRLQSFGSDFLQRLFAHTRHSFDPHITASVSVSLMQKYFVLVGCLFSFGHIRHTELLTHILTTPSHKSTSTLPTKPTTATATTISSAVRTNTRQSHDKNTVAVTPHPKDALLALWPGLQWDEESVDARVQFQYQQARMHYLGQLKRRVLKQWKKE
eukprot:gene25053-30260_t